MSSKHYKLIKVSEYSEENSNEYWPVVWTKIPQRIVDLPGALHVVYNPNTLESAFVVLLKKCRKRVNPGIPVEDFEIYV